MMTEDKPMGSGRVVAPIVIYNDWTSSLCSCLSAPCDCLWMWCCTPCAIGCESGIGSSLGLHETHVGTNNIITYLCSNINLYGFPIWCNILCDCPCGRKYVDPCWTTTVLDTMVQKYNLPYPEPCGERQCCDCKLQMYFCGPCTMCLIQRELKVREAGGSTDYETAQPIVVQPLANL